MGLCCSDRQAVSANAAIAGPAVIFNRAPSCSWLPCKQVYFWSHVAGKTFCSLFNCGPGLPAGDGEFWGRTGDSLAFTQNLGRLIRNWWFPQLVKFCYCLLTDAFPEHGCHTFFTQKVSGRKSSRPNVPSAVDLLSFQWKGEWDQLFTFQGLTPIYLPPSTKLVHVKTAEVLSSWWVEDPKVCCHMPKGDWNKKSGPQNMQMPKHKIWLFSEG